MAGMDAKSKTEREFMTVDDLADYLSVTKSTVYHWNHTGAGPKRRYAGKHVRYYKPDVIDWVLTNPAPSR